MRRKRYSHCSISMLSKKFDKSSGKLEVQVSKNMVKFIFLDLKYGRFC